MELIQEVIEQLNRYLRGWVSYFGIQEFRYPFRDLDAWIRSRLRSMQLKKSITQGRARRYSEFLPSRRRSMIPD